MDYQSSYSIQLPKFINECKKMSERVESAGLQVAKSIYNLVTKDIIPGTNLSESDFWHSFSKTI